MHRLGTIEMQAVAYGIFWLLYNLRSLWKYMEPYDEERLTKAVDGLYSTASLLPFPSLMPGVYAAINLIIIVFDVLGFYLLFAYAGGINWLLKTVTVIVLITMIYHIHGLIHEMQVIHDKEQFLAQLLNRMKKRRIGWVYLGKVARIAAAVLLLAEIYMWIK